MIFFTHSFTVYCREVFPSSLFTRWQALVEFRFILSNSGKMNTRCQFFNVSRTPSQGVTTFALSIRWPHLSCNFPSFFTVMLRVSVCVCVCVCVTIHLRSHMLHLRSCLIQLCSFNLSFNTYKSNELLFKFKSVEQRYDVVYWMEETTDVVLYFFLFLFHQLMRWAFCISFYWVIGNEEKKLINFDCLELFTYRSFTMTIICSSHTIMTKERVREREKERHDCQSIDCWVMMTILVW